jgi:hypothetical protein
LNVSKLKRRRKRRRKLARKIIAFLLPVPSKIKTRRKKKKSCQKMFFGIFVRDAIESNVVHVDVAVKVEYFKDFFDDDWIVILMSNDKMTR